MHALPCHLLCLTGDVGAVLAQEEERVLMVVLQRLRDVNDVHLALVVPMGRHRGRLWHSYWQ